MRKAAANGTARTYPTLEPIASPNVRDMVYERLKEGILNHEFAPGSQLLARQLAVQLNTSTTPVVQVILRLAEEGLVEVIPRRGTFVADLSADRIRQLFEAADAIEGYAARLAVTRVTEAQIQDLRAILTASNAYPSTLDQSSATELHVPFEKDSQFHCRLVAVSGNPFLISMYQKLDSQIWTFVRMRLVANYTRIRPLAAEGHANMLRLLVARDESGLVEAIRQHNLQILAEYAQVLEAMPP
jgi:GntR family transcriptional regulator, rspAB operon transcriptional repressor